MARSSHKYYLKVDDVIIDFDNLEYFKDMEKFLRLSVFTGLFQNKDELFKTLYQLGLVTSENYDDIDIVKKVRNKKDEKYQYVPIDSEITFFNEVRIMDENTINKFLSDNRYNVSALESFFKKFYEHYLRLISIFKNKCSTLIRSYAVAPLEEREEIKEEYDRRQNSLKIFNLELDTINEILRYISILKESKGILDRESEKDYIFLLSRFVFFEAYYVRNSKTTSNFRGLARLSIEVMKLVREQEGLINPRVCEFYCYLKTELLGAISKSIYQNRERCFIQKPNDDDGIDPDTFMFLTTDDYRSMLTEDSSLEEIESVEASVIALAEKRKAFRLDEGINS